MVNKTAACVIFSIYTFYFVLTACFIQSSISYYATILLALLTALAGGAAIFLTVNCEQLIIDAEKFFSKHDFTVYQKLACFMNARNLSLAFTLPGILVPLAFNQRYISLVWFLIAILFIRCCNNAINYVLKEVDGV